VLGRVEAWASDAARTARFLHGRTAFRPRPDDVFVASYPRSGTTWTLVIVHLILSGDDTLGFDHLSDVAPWWERSLAYRTDAAARMEALPGARVFKTHLPRRWLPEGARCLYAWRNAGDVALSYFHLYRRYLGFTGDFDAFFARFLAGDVQYRSWFRHLAGWEREKGDPKVLFVPYDQMRRAPAPWVRRIADFLGRPLSEDRVARIVSLTDFGPMKEAQEKFDHLGELVRQLGIRDGDFIREGKVGAGAHSLSPEQQRALEAASLESWRCPSIEWRLPAFLH
jgi:hypothetical protein